MVHHQDDRLAHAALSCPERIRIAVVLALLCELIGPFFLQLPAVCHLIAL